MDNMLQTMNNGDPNFLEEAKLNYKIVKEDVHTNDLTIPGVKALMRLEDRHFFRQVPEDFEVLQPEEFYELTQSIGGSVHAAGQTEGGEIVWFMTAPQEEKYQTFKINNDYYANYILFALSYDSTLGITILPISINMTRNLTFNISEILLDNQPAIRQSKNIKARSKEKTEFKEVYLNCLSQIIKFQKKLSKLKDERDFNLHETLDSLIPTPKNATQNRITRINALKEEILENHNSLHGTSLYSIFTAIYATDVQKHDKRRANFARRFFSGKTSLLAVKAIQLEEEKVA